MWKGLRPELVAAALKSQPYDRRLLTVFKETRIMGNNISFFVTSYRIRCSAGTSSNTVYRVEY